LTTTRQSFLTRAFKKLNFMSMESLVLNLQSKNQISEYIADRHLMQYESKILNELMSAIDNNDLVQLQWLNSFGDCFRAITMNLHAYRKGLEFGFTEISFDQHSWFKGPAFLETEDLKFGDTTRYGNYSTISLGRGINHIWTYALHYSFGCAGGGYGLSVYGKQFKSRESAFTFALNDLKSMMTEKVGSTDTTNDKQPIILATLKDIAKAEINRIQLSLF
jgi:hypothetical protein